MRRFVDAPLAVEAVRIDDQEVVRVIVSDSVLREWCLCLQLLQDHLVDSFSFRSEHWAKGVSFSIGVAGYSGPKHDANRLELSLSDRELDTVRTFFLQYYRDGAADVDHIDIEDEGGGYLTFSVEQVTKPVQL